MNTNNDKDWDQMVQQTLHSLDGIERATANPFLHTRILASLEERNSTWAKLVGFISRPAVAVSAVVVFVAVNVAVILKHPAADKLVQSASTADAADLGFEPEYATVNYSLMDANSNDR